MARLDVISVKKLTDAIKMKTKSINEIPSNKVIWLPIHNARPLSLNPAARAIPPPNNNKIPHGNLTASSHFKIFLSLFFVGNKNIMIAPIIAMIVSSIPGIIDSSK